MSVFGERYAPVGGGIHHRHKRRGTRRRTLLQRAVPRNMRASRDPRRHRRAHRADRARESRASGSHRESGPGPRPGRQHGGRAAPPGRLRPVRLRSSPGFPLADRDGRLGRGRHRLPGPAIRRAHLRPAGAVGGSADVHRPRDRRPGQPLPRRPGRRARPVRRGRSLLHQVRRFLRAHRGEVLRRADRPVVGLDAGRARRAGHRRFTPGHRPARPAAGTIHPCSEPP